MEEIHVKRRHFDLAAILNWFTSEHFTSVSGVQSTNPNWVPNCKALGIGFRVEQTDGRTDGRTEGRTDGRTDGQTDGRTTWAVV